MKNILSKFLADIIISMTEKKKKDIVVYSQFKGRKNKKQEKQTFHIGIKLQVTHELHQEISHEPGFFPSLVEGTCCDDREMWQLTDLCFDFTNPSCLGGVVERVKQWLRDRANKSCNSISEKSYRRVV